MKPHPSWRLAAFWLYIAAEEKSGDPGPKGKPVHLKDYERQRLLEKGRLKMVDGHQQIK